MKKKAVEISLNTVIIAAIGLIVLIVMVVIFTNQSGKTVRGINDCKARGGVECEPTASQCISNGGVPAGSCIFYEKDGSKMSGYNEDHICCVFKKT